VSPRFETSLQCGDFVERWGAASASSRIAGACLLADCAAVRNRIIFSSVPEHDEVPSDRVSGDRWVIVELVSGEASRDPKWAGFRSALRDEIERYGGSIVDSDAAIDLRPLAVVGCGAGEDAVGFAAGSPGVSALVLVRCDLTQDSIELISECSHAAVYTLADPADRTILAASLDGHLASPHDSSDIEVAAFDTSLAPMVAAWVDHRISSGIHVEEVTIPTPDGWGLGADLIVPANAHAGAVAPAVVLMHSGRSDRAVFDRLAPLLAQRGVAALALDWRGRGESTNLGRFVDFTSEQQAAVAGDVTASYDYLSSRSEIDGTRLGVLGIAHGAGYGANGALGDKRTKALAMMTAYHLLEKGQEEVLQTGDVAVLCVACTPNKMSSGALREIYSKSTNPSSRMMEFSEGVLGYQLFDLHAHLEPAIADWFAEALGP